MNKYTNDINYSALKKFNADNIDLSEHTYVLSTNSKPIKIILEGPASELDLANDIDEVCTKIRTADLEALKHFISIHFK